MRLCAVVLAVGVVGCGPSSFEDFRNQAVQIACDQQVRCGLVGKSERETRCQIPEQLFSYVQPGAVTDLVGGIKLGKMKFNSSGAQSCLDAMRSSPCEPLAAQQRMERYCHHIVQPASPIGAACDGPGECEGGTCMQTASGCEGRCVAYPFPGSRCVPFGGRPEETCDPTTQFCAQAAADGGVGDATCHLRRQYGQLCNPGDECAFGLQCDATNHCGHPARLPRGAPCTAVGTLCDDGIYCAPTGTCTAQKNNEEVCDNAIACRDSMQCLSLQANGMTLVPGKCHGFVDLGGSCDPAADPGSTGCPASQRCDDTGTCIPDSQPPRAAYQKPCSMSLPCRSGLVCDGTRCEFPVFHNGACPTPVCAQFLTCTAELCRRQTVCR